MGLTPALVAISSLGTVVSIEYVTMQVYVGEYHSGGYVCRNEEQPSPSDGLETMESAFKQVGVVFVVFVES